MAAAFWLVLGLALFLLGLHTLSVGLRHSAGPTARRLLATVTKTRWRGLLVGAAATALIQSSSAVNVTVISFVRAGMLDVAQAIGVMLGTNIGTTVTSQLIAFDLFRWTPLIVAVGLGLYGGAHCVASRLARRLRFGGGALIGFGALLIGMDAMGLGLTPLAAHADARAWLARWADHPGAAIVAGAVFTGLLQSSSLTTGMTMVMAESGLIDLASALGIVFGANIGTVVTTLLASVGAPKAARRAALADFVFNVAGVALFAPLLPLFAALVATTATGGARQVANGHVLFNVITALLAFPLVPQLAALVRRLVPDTPGQE